MFIKLVILSHFLDSLIKSRVRQGVPCYEIAWNKLGKHCNVKEIIHALSCYSFDGIYNLFYP